MEKIILDHRVAILDTETTGLSSTAEACEITLLDSIGNEIFNSLVKPKNPIPDEAIAIHGITNQMVADAPEFTEIAVPLWQKLNHYDTVVIYNAGYDVKLLKQAASINGIKDYLSDYRGQFKCAMLWYSKFIEKSRWTKLVEACKSMKINITQFKAHRAKADCLMTLELIKAVNSKIDIINTCGNVRYIGTQKKFINQVGKFEGMLPQTTTAKVMFNSDKQYIDISDLILEREQTVTETITPEIIENSQPVKNLPATIDVMAEVTITSAKLDYDKHYWLKVIDNMSIEDINSAFLKKLNQDRIDLMKQVNAEAEILNQDLKDVYAHAERRIAHLKAEAEKAEKLRREDKRAEVTILLSDLKAKSNLPQKYLDKIELKESYLQITFKGKKLTEDIQAQFDLQERLFKADEDAIALKAANTKNRQMLLDKLNLAYGLKYTYADFLVESFTDDKVEDEYERIAKAKRHEEELKRQREEKKAEAIATEKEFLDDLPSAPAVKESLPVEQVVSKTEITEPSENSEQLPTDLPEYDLPEDLPAYDLPDVELSNHDNDYGWIMLKVWAKTEAEATKIINELKSKYKVEIL
jgi:DNA polymerase III epsilon subunit-like protein